MADLTREFKQAARGFGADLVGIASLDRFDGVPAEHHPASIAPDARAVVVLGRRITRGIVQAIEQGTNWQTYQLFGYYWLDTEFLAMTVFEAAEWLEDRGWEACPVFPFPPETPPQGIPVREGQPAPNVFLDMNYAAVAAGLGEIGWCDVFLTPDFGPLQRLQVILTDAPLAPDPLFEGQICTQCKVCVAVCPLSAMVPHKEERLSVAGREFVVASVSYDRCRRCQNGAQPNRYHSSGKPDRLAALCVRSCLAVLDEAGRLRRKFEHPFRREDYWAIDALGQVVTPTDWRSIRAARSA